VPRRQHPRTVAQGGPVCVAEFAQVVTVRPDGALVVRSTVRSTVVSPLALDAPAPVGSWVLVHAGFALHVVDGPDGVAGKGAQP
jgi:hydrogenase maturation factor